MTIIKATLRTYQDNSRIDFYFRTHQTEIQLSQLSEKVCQTLTSPPDFTTDEDYNRLVPVDNLIIMCLEDAAVTHMLSFNTIEPVDI